MKKLLSALLLAATFAFPALANDVHIVADSKGISKITTDETGEVNLTNPRFFTLYRTFTSPDGSVKQANSTPKATPLAPVSPDEVAGNHYAFAGGFTDIRYRVAGNKLTWDFVVVNTGDEDRFSIASRFAWIGTPDKQKIFADGYSTKYAGSPQFLLGKIGDDPVLATKEGWSDATFSIGGSYYNGHLLMLDRTQDVFPGETRKFSYSLRFGEAGDTIETLGADALAAYRVRNPYVLDHEDHRAIGRLFAASPGPHPPGNPRGWLNNNKSFDVNTPEGQATFAQLMIKVAQKCVINNRLYNVQGTIWWDLAGHQFGQPISYDGGAAIRDLNGKIIKFSLPPELEQIVEYEGVKRPLVDHLFAILRDGDTRAVGLTIRPTDMLKDAWNSPVYPSHYYGPSLTQTYIDKATYAHNRWGATLFYVDSNGDREGQVFRDVLKACPWGVFVPEHGDVDSYASTLRYQSADHLNIYEPSTLAKTLYPRAAGVTIATPAQIKADPERFVRIVMEDGILMLDSWWGNELNVLVKGVYDEAAARKAAKEIK